MEPSLVVTVYPVWVDRAGDRSDQSPPVFVVTRNRSGGTRMSATVSIEWTTNQRREGECVPQFDGMEL